MTPHTAGPWHLEIVKHGGDWDYNIRTVKPHNPGANQGRGGVGIHIAIVNKYVRGNIRGDEYSAADANGLVMAAAPELLAAAKAIASSDGTTTELLDMLRAAIDKAEGREP